MAQSREERKLRASLDEREQGLLKIIEEYEQGELVLTDELASALKTSPLTLIAFACLGSKRGCEEIVEDINRTILFYRFHKRLQKLFEVLKKTDPQTTLHIILPDFEPRRTWGWKKEQDEITFSCLVIRDEITLPLDWKIHLWSELEADELEFSQSLDQVTKFTRPQILDEETHFFRELAAKHPDILTNGQPREIAKRQLAAYANEGRVLERVYPNGILLQADVPTERRDTMFAPLRKNPLAIIHPFVRE